MNALVVFINFYFVALCKGAQNNKRFNCTDGTQQYQNVLDDVKLCEMNLVFEIRLFLHSLSDARGIINKPGKCRNKQE